MKKQLNRYELVEPTEVGYLARIECLEKQMLKFKQQNENLYPFIAYSKNQNWNEIHLTKSKEMLISSNEDIEYYAITFLNSIWADSTTSVDMALDDQVEIDDAYHMYKNYCYKKDSVSFKKFYDAYLSSEDELMELII